MKRIVSLILVTVMLLALPMTVWAADPTPEEDGRETYELKTNDGKSTGVIVTKIHYDKNAGRLSDSHHYGKEVISVEADLSNTNVTMRVMSNYNGERILNTVRDTMDYYMSDAEGEELLAGFNADGFYYISVGAMCAGTMIIDGEVWNTNPYSYSSTGASDKNTDVSWGGSNDYILGVTKENQPLVGLVRFTTTIHNDDTDQTVSASGINRNTGSASLVIYNKRFLNSPYYENHPAYMLVVEVEDTAFTTTNEVKGTVKAIYTENDAASVRTAALDDHTVIVSATGNAKIKNLKENFSVGDSITMKTRIKDEMGHTELWENINSAVGGHIIVLKDGKIADAGLHAYNNLYAVTIAGYNNDGRLMITTFTADVDCKYGGFAQGDVVEMCQQLGYNTCFYLDGGGSTTLVTKNDEGENVLTSHYVDGYADGNPVERRVGNSVYITWTEQPLCEEQGDLDYMKFDESRIIYVDASVTKETPAGDHYYPHSNGINYILDEEWDENDVCHYYYCPFNYEAYELPTEAPTEPPTEPPTEAPTDAPTEAPTAAPTEPATEPAPATDPATEPETEPDKGGCTSALTLLLPVMLLVPAAALCGKRRKQD